ncbi:MAG: GNAT family N-acetyltransferase [Pseudomonadota bacterium]
MQDLQVDLVDDISLLKSEWEDMQAEGTSFICQNYDWVRIAYETFDSSHRPVIITGRNSDGIQFILPLVLVTGMPSRLRWPGGNHVNLGTGLFSRKFLEEPGHGTMRFVFEQIGKKLPGIIVLHLKNQPQKLLGYPNPLLELPHQPNPNPLYVMDLKPGFEAILDMGNGKRKRKIFRRQHRVAESLGGYELVTPTDKDEISSIMDEFFAMKSERFAELGIPDAFGDTEAREFLSALAGEPEKNGTQLLRLMALKVDGKMRAMYGSGILPGYCQACINAVAYDDFAEESPGEMIMYLMVDHLINEGFEYLDLGVGHERYKISWCKKSHQIMDTIYPLSYGAIPFSQYLRSETRMKEIIKGNHTLWENFKKVRKLKGRI